MNKRNFAVGSKCSDILEFAVEKGFPLTITTKKGETWQVYRSNILALKSNKIVLACPVPHRADCQLEIVPGHEIAISFKKGYNKCLFTSRIISQKPFELEDGRTIPAFELYRPEQIEKIQRRHFDRADVPPGEPVPVSFWSLCGPEEQSFQGTLINLSAGGAAVSIETDQIPLWQENCSCYVQFFPLPDQDPLLLQARFRYVSQVDSPRQHQVGFQFVGLEADEKGRNLLRRIARVVGVYQRRNKMADIHSHSSRRK